MQQNTFNTSKVFVVFTPSRDKSRNGAVEFESFIPVMSGFHMARPAMRCLGKHLQGCGAEDALTELGAFGQKVIDARIGATSYIVHYVG